MLMKSMALFRKAKLTLYKSLKIPVLLYGLHWIDHIARMEENTSACKMYNSVTDEEKVLPNSELDLKSLTGDIVRNAEPRRPVVVPT